MKSHVVLVLWCINLCSELVASIPLNEDLARHLVGAQPASGLPSSNVLENKNAHSQIHNPVGLRQPYGPELRGDTQRQAVGENRVPVTPQDVNAPVRHQDLPMKYRGGPMPFRPELPFNQQPLRQPQVPQNQPYVGPPSEAPIQPLHLRQPFETQPHEPRFSKPLVEEQSKQQPIIRERNEVNLPLIRKPGEVQNNQQILRQRAPPNVEPSKQPRVPLNLQPPRPSLGVTLKPKNQQLISQPHEETVKPALVNQPHLSTRPSYEIPSNEALPRPPTVPVNPTQTFERPFARPAEVPQNQQFLAQPVNNQFLRPQPPPGLNIQQIATHNELRKTVVDATRPKSRYIVVYPDGKVEYVDQLEPITKKFPNYTMVNGHEAVAANAALVNPPIQTQNVVGQQPSKLSQFITKPGPQTPVTNDDANQIIEAQIQAQTSILQRQTQVQAENNQIGRNPNNEFKKQSVVPQEKDVIVRDETTFTSRPLGPIDEVPAPDAYTPIVTGFADEEVPFELVETGPEYLIKSDRETDLKVVETSYGTVNSQSESQAQIQSTGFNSRLGNNDNQSQTIQNTILPSAHTNLPSNRDLVQSQSEEQSQCDSEVEDVVQSEIAYTILKRHSHEQQEPNSSPEQYPSSNEQQQIQSSQEETQGSSENQGLLQTELSTQHMQNQFITGPETLTQTSASSSAESSNSSEYSSECYSETNDTKETSPSSETQRQSQSQTSKTQLNDTNSEAEGGGKPYTWFSTNDPDFFDKLLGKDKVLGVVYFFMVPSDAPEYD